MSDPNACIYCGRVHPGVKLDDCPPPLLTRGGVMTPETAEALRSAVHDLIVQSGFAEQSALRHRTQADAHAARAEGLRRAANVITNALAEAAQ